MKASTSHIETGCSRWAMTCLTFAQPNYHHHGLLLRFLKAIATPEGVAISSAIYERPIANYLVQHYAGRCFQFLPESMANLATINWRDIYPCAGFGEIPVTLANRDTEASTMTHPFTGNSSVSRSRFRRLDSIYADSKRQIDVLYIAESSSRILDIFEGSRALISRDQPALIIELNNISNITDLVRGLEALNYQLLDSSLMPIVDDENHGIHAAVETETCFLGLSKTFLQANGLPKAFWPKDAHLTNHQDWQQALIAGFTREARNGGIRFGSPPPTRNHHPFNDQLLCKGFYPTEHHDGNEWRWLGPKPSAIVWLPQPRAGRYRLELIVIGASVESVINGTHLFYEGTFLILTRETTDGITKLITTIEIPAEEETPLIELVIAVPSTHRANPDDPRMLGICVSHLDLVAVTAGD